MFEKEVASPGKLTLYDIGVNRSGRPVHARLCMNVENTPCELIFGTLFPSDASSSIAQQQLLILCGSLVHSQVWYSDCNAELFPFITVMKPGANRLTSRHTDITILTKVEENMSLVVFDNSNSSFIIIAEKPISRSETLNCQTKFTISHWNSKEIKVP